MKEIKLKSNKYQKKQFRNIWQYVDLWQEHDYLCTRRFFPKSSCTNSLRRKWIERESGSLENGSYLIILPCQIHITDRSRSFDPTSGFCPEGLSIDCAQKLNILNLKTGFVE